MPIQSLVVLTHVGLDSQNLTLWLINLFLLNPDRPTVWKHVGLWTRVHIHHSAPRGITFEWGGYVNQGTCPPLSSPGNHIWVGRVCEPGYMSTTQLPGESHLSGAGMWTRVHVHHSAPRGITFEWGGYVNQGTCPPLSSPGNHIWVGRVCEPGYMSTTQLPGESHLSGAGMWTRVHVHHSAPRGITFEWGGYVNQGTCPPLSSPGNHIWVGRVCEPGYMSTTQLPGESHLSGAGMWTRVHVHHSAPRGITFEWGGYVNQGTCPPLSSPGNHIWVGRVCEPGYMSTTQLPGESHLRGASLRSPQWFTKQMQSASAPFY